MCTRIRMTVAISAALFLLTALPAFAKGGFDFLTVTGPDLEGGVRIDDSRLTEDFFTFSNFYEDKAEAPADPGKGYEITRHYMQGNSDLIFDRLHYYPDTGFVYYDGIENGDSEYDGEWYTARKDIEPVFESVLAAQIAALAAKDQPVVQSSKPLPSRPSISKIPSLPFIALVAGLAILFALAFRSSRSAPR